MKELAKTVERFIELRRHKNAGRGKTFPFEAVLNP